MSDGLAVGEFQHLGVVVADIESAMKGNSRFFGIPEWQLRRFEGDRLPGFEENGFLSALGSHNGVTMELLQPLTSASPHAAFRNWRGQGMSHVVSRCSAVQFTRLQQQLAEVGMGKVHGLRLDGKVSSMQIDSRRQLSGLGLEVQVEGGVGFDDLAVDRVVEYDYAPLLPIDKYYHLGIVVSDRDRATANFRKYLGLPEFLPLELEVGSNLSSVRLRGESIHHAARVAFSRGKGFCFELMEPGAGQGAYQEFQTSYGEGMQHYFPTICDQQVLDEALSSLRKWGVEVLLEGVIDGVMNYYYLDTDSLLGGVTVEVICPHTSDWMEVMGMSQEAGYLIGL